MAWDSSQRSRGHAQSTRIGGRDFWLVPKSEDTNGFPVQGQTPEPLRFEDPKVREYDEYQYKKLPSDKKMIRLLKLYPGEALGSEIYCELMEVQYDREFHIPTQEDQGGERGSGDGKSIGDDKEDEGERSDQEKLHEKEVKETNRDRVARKRRQELRELNKAVADLEKDPEEEKKREEEILDKRFRRWQMINKKEEKYEALSWCWGNEEEDYVILIKREGKKFRKRVRKELALALKYLRRPGQERTLWIDAICINQNDPNERNHQVQMMSRVYTRAQQVCIWLGAADADSEIAIKFIKDEMKELKNFDTISSNEQYSRKWQALMSLMQRDWFFRRWVVQEIALASAAMVYCGPHSVPWKSFAVAVELFVEVETATHRLSEVMKRDEKFRHVPGWFEYVSQLGASLLVQATGRVFRTQRSPMQPGPGGFDDGTEGDTKYDKSEDGEKEKERKKKEEDMLIRERLKETQTIDPLERRSLLSLEYLVSTMFIFQASEPRDVVYALLAIARDASPFAPAHYGQEDQKLFLVMTLLDRFLAEKPFEVDYNRPYSDVSRDFVEFSIARMHKIDPYQALDILCRPWALEPPRGKSKWLKNPKVNEADAPKELMRQRKTLSWKKREKMPVEKNPDWTEKGREFKYRYNKDHSSKWVEDKFLSTTEYRDNKLLKVECIKPNCDHIDKTTCSSSGWPVIQKKYFPSTSGSSGDSKQLVRDIDLPSWVSRASQAPFMLDHAPGMDMRKTSRANADPLVGTPSDGHRNYNASGSEKLDLTTLKFRKRPVMGHYSLYIKGFELDTVTEVEDASQLGSIPRAWLDAGGWTDLTQDPPDQFWRTIVADRGRDNRNPPYYYARACKESVHKGSHLGGSVNTAALINDEQNSIVAEFCRRVHAVIWNRCLFKTKNKRLGLASKVKVGDKVCILYGCTVPVILRETKKEEVKENGKVIATPERDLEAEEDRVETLKACIRRAASNRERKAKYRPKKKVYEKNEEWQVMMDARLAYLEEKRRKGAKSGKKEAGEKWEAKVKEDRKAERQVLASKIKEAKSEKRDAESVIEVAELDIENAEDDRRAAQKSLEEAMRSKITLEEAEESAQEAGRSNTGAAEDAAEELLATARAAQDEAIAAGQQATQISEEVKAAADNKIAKANNKITEAKDKIAEANNKITEAKDKIAEAKKRIAEANKKIAEAEEAALKAAEAEAIAEEDAIEGAAVPNNVPVPEDAAVPEPDNPEKSYWYEFKGECYLHGMMDGEAMREKFYKDLKDWTFELR